MRRWLLSLVLLLQVALSSLALETVRGLIAYGTQIAPRELAVSMIIAACFAVALVASFGRAETLVWRMGAVAVCQMTAASVWLWAGLAGDSLAGAASLPPNEIYGREWVLSTGIRVPRALSVLLTPLPIVIAAVQVARRPRAAPRVPVHVAAALFAAAASLAIILPQYTTGIEARRQPEGLVRLLLEDRREAVREWARAALIQLPKAEQEKVRPTLLKALDHPSPAVQLQAASVLKETEADASLVIARLVDLLDTPIEPTHIAGVGMPPSFAAAQMLGAMGPKAAPAVPALMELLRLLPGKNYAERDLIAAAATALGQIGDPAKAAAPLLLVYVSEWGNPDLRYKIAAAVDRLDPALARRCTDNGSTMVEASNKAMFSGGRVTLKAECVEMP